MNVSPQFKRALEGELRRLIEQRCVAEMTKRDERQAIIDAFAEMGIEAMYGKGGFWLRGKGGEPTRHVSFAQARKMTGVDVSGHLKRQHLQRTSWGDMATVAMLNAPNVKIGKKK